MKHIETGPSLPARSPLDEAVSYYARLENEGALTNLQDFYATYVDWRQPAPTATIDGVSREFPELLSLGVDEHHIVYVIRSTQEMISYRYAEQELYECGFIVAEFDPDNKASEYTIALPRFGKLENATPGASKLTLALDAQQQTEAGIITKTAHFYLTSQGIYKLTDGEFVSVDDALHLPQLIDHERTQRA